MSDQKKRLIIITKLFPYNFTEAFLESEVPYLKKEFNDIIFLPLLKGKVRPNFKDVAINDSYNKLYKNKLSYCFKALFSIHLYRAIWKHRKEKRSIQACFKQTIHLLILKKIVFQNKELFNENTIIYSYWFNAPVYAFIKLKKEFNLKYKVICRAHRWDVYEENEIMPYRQFCIENIDKIFPISQDACNFFTQKYRHHEKYQLSRLGVKSNMHTTPKSTDKNQLKVLTISQIIQRKRLDLTLNALTELALKSPNLNINWTHFGTGPLKDELENEINKVKNIPNLSICLMGYVPNKEIIHYLESNTVDVFINLSSSEGVPVSIMEAQSLGIPVIATNVGGSGEIITNDNGILLSANPNLNEVYKAFIDFISRDWDREYIKAKWNELSNADINFPQFTQQLLSI